MGRAFGMTALRLLGASALLSALVLVAAEASDWRGISRELQQKLEAATSISCDSGTLKLPLTRLNDNYCDCEDGSDEPGTSACSHTRAVFHCANRGFFSTDVPTSHVNDGVCDCCDASDEYASGATCSNDCDERMTEFRAERSELIELLDAGAKDRASLEKEARELWEETQKEATQLEASTASLRVMVEQLQARKEEEERVEQEEKHKRAWGGKQELMRQLGLLEMTAEQLASIILAMTREGLTEKHQVLGFIRKEREAAANEAGLEKTPMDEQDEEFVKRDNERQKETRRIEKKLEKRRKEQEKREKAAREAEEAAREAGEATDAKADETTEAEVGTPASIEAATEPSEEEEEELTLPEVEPRPIDLLFDALATSENYESPEAGETRTKYEEAKKELKEEEKKLEKAQKVADKYYGPDNLFLALRDTCVESDPSAYTYKICFFGKATQDKIKLGDMEDLQAPGQSAGEDVDASEGELATSVSGLELKWTKGIKCWNGPNRSLTVTLECGPLPMVLYEVDEPQTCVYTAKLRTPMACDEAQRQKVMTLDNGGAPVGPHHIEIEVSPTL